MAQRRRGTEPPEPGDTSMCVVKLSLPFSLYVAAAGFPTDGEGGGHFYNVSVVWKAKPRSPVACIGAKNKSAIGVQGAVRWSLKLGTGLTCTNANAERGGGGELLGLSAGQGGKPSWPQLSEPLQAMLKKDWGYSSCQS